MEEMGYYAQVEEFTLAKRNSSSFIITGEKEDNNNTQNSS